MSNENYYLTNENYYLTLNKCCVSSSSLGHAERKVERQVDRISRLPDEVITYILSFLPTKEAIATSVLSHRWISLWTFTDALHFPNHCPSFPTKENFVDIMNSVLSQRNSTCIKRLFFSIHNNSYIPHLVSSIVSMATNQKVEEIDLSLYRLKVYLPPELFTCKTLTVLRLVGTFHLNIPSHVHLPMLKILHLNLLCFVDDDDDDDDDALMRFLSSCPALEQLFYEEVKFKRTSLFGICVPSLKRLFVRSFDERLHINTPLLEYLVIKETKAINYVVENLEKLKEAHIGIHFDYEKKKVKENIANLFNGIRKTRFLCLDLDSTEVLTYACLEFPTFVHLGHLQLYLKTLDSHFLVKLLLEKCPNLEFLEIIKVDELCDNEIEWIQPTIVPSCLSSYLTTFIFRDYEGTDEEFELISYILNSGKVLKRTTIYFESSWNPSETSDAVLELSSLPRASKDNRTNYVLQSCS